MNTSAQARPSIPNQFAMLSAWSLVTMLGTGAIWVGVIYRIPHPLCVLLGHATAVLAAKMFLGRRALYAYVGITGSWTLYLAHFLPEFPKALVAIAVLVLTVASMLVSKRIPVTLHGGWILVGGTALQLVGAGLAEDPTSWAKGAFYVTVIVHAMTAIVFAYYRRLQKKSASPPTQPVA